MISTYPASLTFEQISYAYSRSEGAAIASINLHVKPGELVVLVGPSGCGKSTLLKLVSGLISPDQGRLLIDGIDVSGVPPQKRQVGWVPQSYALFDHLTVAENVAFGLRMQSIPSANRKRQTQAMLELCHIAELAQRAVSELSGGQRQRVAIARALAIRPRVLLLDEPLAALDPQLRSALRTNLENLLRETGVTTLFVTHDQAEALAIADRIAVLRNGQVEQYGTPEELWNTPVNEFVAQFLGDAQVVQGRLVRTGEVEIVPGLVAKIDPTIDLTQLQSDTVQLALHPTDFQLDPTGVKAIAITSEYVGGRYLTHVQVVNGPKLCLFLEPMLSPGTMISIHLRSDANIAVIKARI
jgi:putative spermidine/putrescine transport system ATP-binding protein